jgi:hypothetical protein
MKKFTFALMALLAFTFSLKAQQYVSTEPTNRNVILEEFTGRTCVWCPSGHVVANQIAANHPGRFWSVNIHSNGYFSATSYPNLNTDKGNLIRAGFNATSFPSGVVNRTTAGAIGRGEWTGQANTQFNQLAECNVAGFVALNPATRVASITVEVYYTGNSAVDENYLTVAMLQDSILGSQTGMSDNPAQVIGNQYCHMHILRDFINESLWGDPISPTTQGTLITRTYTYQVPEMIGSPNGVEVDLNNIHFVAWVSERFQGNPSRPILNANQLDLVFGTDDPIYPAIMRINQTGGNTCTHTKDVEIGIQNLGTDAITSMTVLVEMEGQTQTINWEGEMPQYADEKLTTTMEVPFGTHPITATIIEANGSPYTFEATGSLNCIEWAEIETEEEEVQMRLDLMQDKYGAQITWDVKTADGIVLASGGPYTTLAGATSTQLHVEMFTVPANECATFHIHDGGQNGICCSYGHGYYLIKDSDGNVLIGDENNGQFGSDASHLISVRGPEPQVNVNIGETQVSGINYNHADFIAPLDYEGFPDEVGFECRKVTSSEPMIVQGFLNEFRNILGFTDDLEMSTIYVVKAYAVVNGETYYGQETTFQTWMEGVNELMQSLKVYPNPASNVLNIEGEGMTQVEVYNTMGQRVMMMEVDGNAAKVNTESLSNGMYVVRIHANDGTVLNRTFSVAK